MGYQIDSDTVPPVIGAVLTVAVGSLQELTLTVPRSYYDGLADEPEYIFAAGYGGKVESIALSDAQVVITAKSRAGNNTVDYLRINPSASEYASETVRGWLSNLAAGANGTAAFSGDGEILGSRPLTAGLAIGDFFSTLCQLAGCFGLDVVHTAADAGDVYKFVHAAVTAAGAVNAVLSLSVQGSKSAYDYAGIVKTAPIDQRDTCTISAERNNNPYGINYTSQGHPYLEGTWNPVDIPVYWRQWTLGNGIRFNPEDLAQYDHQLQLTDDEPHDMHFKDAIVLAPFFGKLTENITSVSHSFSAGAIDSAGAPMTNPSTSPPVNGDYLEEYGRGESTKYFCYGVWPTNVDYGKDVYTWEEIRYNRDSAEPEYIPYFEEIIPYFDPENPTTTFPAPNGHNGVTNSKGSDIWVYEGEDDEYFQEKPYVFEQSCLESSSMSYKVAHLDRRMYGEGYVIGWGYWGSNRTQFVDMYEAGSDINRRAYPWMLLAREIISSNVVSDNEHDDFGSKDTLTQEAVVSKALFDASFDDTYHPATIDPNPPTDIHLDKHSATWFDPTASPPINHQFMGFGLVANIKYQMGWNSQYIMMRIAGGAGAATARWDNGSKVQRYNAADWYLAEIPDGSSGSVKHTLISSNSRSFSTVDGTEEGEGYIVSGTVWSSKAIAAACVPHILRQQNRTVQVNFSVHLSVSALDAVVEMVGAAVSVGGHTVYITSVSCDFASETAAFAGCVLAA